MPEPQVGMVIILWKLQRHGSYVDQMGASHEAHIFLEEIVCEVFRIENALLKVRSKDDPSRVFFCNAYQWERTGGQHWTPAGHADPEIDHADAIWAWSWGRNGLIPCATSDGQPPQRPAYVAACDYPGRSAA